MYYEPRHRANRRTARHLRRSLLSTTLATMAITTASGGSPAFVLTGAETAADAPARPHLPGALLHTERARLGRSGGRDVIAQDEAHHPDWLARGHRPDRRHPRRRGCGVPAVCGRHGRGIAGQPAALDPPGSSRPGPHRPRPARESPRRRPGQRPTRNRREAPARPRRSAPRRHRGRPARSRTGGSTGPWARCSWPRPTGRSWVSTATPTGSGTRKISTTPPSRSPSSSAPPARTCGRPRASGPRSGGSTTAPDFVRAVLDVDAAYRRQLRSDAAQVEFVPLTTLPSLPSCRRCRSRRRSPRRSPTGPHLVSPARGLRHRPA